MVVTDDRDKLTPEEKARLADGPWNTAVVSDDNVHNKLKRMGQESREKFHPDKVVVEVILPNRRMKELENSSGAERAGR